MSVSIFILTIIVIILFGLISKKIYQNVQLYQMVSNQADFLPNPSWAIGHMWSALEGSYRGYTGFNAFKQVTARARTDPFKESGLMWGWIGSPILGVPMVIPTRTELLKAVLGSKQRVEKGLIYYGIQDIFGSGLISSDKLTWSQHRKLLNPTFHQDLLHHFVPVMSKESKNLVTQLRMECDSNSNHIISDVTTLISHRVMAMLLGTVMSFENEEMDSEFFEAAENFDNVQFLRLQNPIKLIKVYYDKTEEGKKYYKMVNNLRDYGCQLLRKRMEQMISDQTNANPFPRLTLLDTIIEEHLRDPKKMTLKNVEDQFLTFIAAGWDTTTWTASFTLQLIGDHQHIQDKLISEIDTVMENVSDNEDMSMKDISNLKYTESVIKETLRLYPLVNFHSRWIEEELRIEIDGKTRIIPARTDMLIDAELIHRSPRYWTDPDKFDPDRFLSASDKDPLAFIPFSFGPRNCIGKQFAMIEEKIMIAHILRHFRIYSVFPIDKIRMNMSGLARRTYEPIKLKMVPRR